MYMNYVDLDFMGYVNYKIGEDGVVYVKNTMEVIEPELSTLKTCAVVTLYKGMSHRKFNVAGIMLMAFDIKLQTNKGDLSYKDFMNYKWKISYKDGNVMNTALSNLYIIDELYYLGNVDVSSTSACAKTLESNKFEDTVLTPEEAYGLIYRAVEIAYKTKKQPILCENYSIDDLFSHVYMVLLERDAFKKFNRAKATKKTYINRIVGNALIDMVRTFKETYSLDFNITGKDGSSMSFEEVIEDRSNDYEDLLHNELAIHLINTLSDGTNNPIYGKSPVIGTCCLTQRTVALHLYLGYSNKELQEMFGVTARLIRKYKSEIQEELAYVLENYKAGYGLVI